MRAAALAFSAVVVLAGCGGSSSGSHATQRHIDPADQKWVESMLLTTGELPAGWTNDPDDSPNPPDDCERLDTSDLVITGEGGASFKKGETTTLQNGIEVYKSTDDAHESLARGDAADIESCLAEVAIEEQPEDSDVAIRNVRVTELDPEDVGEESRLFAITWDYVQRSTDGFISYTAGRQAQSDERAPFAIRLVAFRRGRSIGVVSAGELFGPAPAGVAGPLARELDKKMAADPPPKN